MKRFAIAASLAFALSGCDQMAIKAGQKVAAQDLLDPNSAQFRDIVVRDDGSVCGQMNGKNRMGGYVGFQRFIVRKDTGEVLHEPPDPLNLALNGGLVSLRIKDDYDRQAEFEVMSKVICGT